MEYPLFDSKEVSLQTFLPYASVTLSVRALDPKRLGKQRLEAWQIYQILQGKSRGWYSHPAVRMWHGYSESLKMYYNCCLTEWERRGNENVKLKRIPLDWRIPLDLPPWMGDPQFHASHRSNLLRKWPEYYSSFGWTEPPDLPYMWPTMQNYRKTRPVNAIRLFGLK